MAGWLTVIGIGEDGLDGLGKTALAALNSAAVIFGGKRHLGFLVWQYQSRARGPAISIRRSFRDD